MYKKFCIDDREDEENIGQGICKDCWIVAICFYSLMPYGMEYNEYNGFANHCNVY